ncbi:unnamed protein product, partial [Laminaria digitata]
RLAATPIVARVGRELAVAEIRRPNPYSVGVRRVPAAAAERSVSEKISGPRSPTRRRSQRTPARSLLPPPPQRSHPPLWPHWPHSDYCFHDSYRRYCKTTPAPYQ